MSKMSSTSVRTLTYDDCPYIYTKINAGGKEETRNSSGVSSKFGFGCLCQFSTVFLKWESRDRVARRDLGMSRTRLMECQRAIRL